MKIYTEIVYKWDEEKGQLVEESSKSYDYVGPVSQCHRKAYPHPHGGIAGALYDAGTDIGEGTLDILGDVTGAAGDTGSALTETITKSGKKAWSEMSTYAGDIWEKGGTAVTDIWQGTGMEDMAAKWTDPQAMKDAWMPGKWAADSPFQSKWMMGMDMLKHKEGFSMSDFQQYRQNLFEEFDRWESAANTNIASGNEGIENIIDENTDSLNDLESGINTTISDTVENVEQGVENLATVGDAGVSIINMTSDIAHQGLDASVNINNPQSLLSNPSKWWELNTEGAASGDWFFDSEEAKDSMAGKGADVLSDAFEPMYDWLAEGVAGVSDTYVGIGESLGSQLLNQRSKTGLEGDPFGMEGPRRRDILEKKTFKDRGGAIAPSRINQGGYGNMG